MCYITKLCVFLFKYTMIKQKHKVSLHLCWYHSGSSLTDGPFMNTTTKSPKNAAKHHQHLHRPAPSLSVLSSEVKQTPKAQSNQNDSDRNVQNLREKWWITLELRFAYGLSQKAELSHYVCLVHKGLLMTYSGVRCSDKEAGWDKHKNKIISEDNRRLEHWINTIN